MAVATKRGRTDKKSDGVPRNQITIVKKTKDTGLTKVVETVQDESFPQLEAGPGPAPPLFFSGNHQWLRGRGGRGQRTLGGGQRVRGAEAREQVRSMFLSVSHICLLIVVFCHRRTVKVSYMESHEVKEYTWCWKVPPRCPKWRTVISTR